MKEKTYKQQKLAFNSAKLKIADFLLFFPILLVVQNNHYKTTKPKYAQLSLNPTIFAFHNPKREIVASL